MARFHTTRWAGLATALLTLHCGGKEPPQPRATTAATPPSSVAASPTTPATEADANVDTNTAPAPADGIHGRLTTIDGQRVLQVYGTPTQMGHAHGALLRESILEIVDGYALDVIPPATLDAAGAIYDSVAQIPPRLREEAEGLIAGMKDAGGADSERLGRPLRASDMLALNAMTDLLAIGCSSLSTWGPGTEDEPALAGAPVMVRNLDWSEDPQLLRNQVIIAYRPDDPDRQPLVSVAFAGYIGCLSCMNEAGVSALFNMGYGDGAASPAQALAGFAPANLLLRDTLERRDIDDDGKSTADDVEAAWKTATHAGSYIVHLLEPRRPGVDSPARVLEVEADGMAVRAPADGDLGAHLLAATNHLRRKTEPSSCSRYSLIERRTAKREQRFDRDALWELGVQIRLPEVVHTLLVEPEARRLGVWLRAPGQPRTAGDPAVVHEWDALMGPPPG